MRLTADRLAAHRLSVVESGSWQFEYGMPLPARSHDFDYTSGCELFGDDWTDFSAATLKEGLRIVVVLAFTDSLPNLRFDREWLAIQHQSGGHASDQLSMIGTRLRPKASVADALLRIARDRYDECNGWFTRCNLRASQIVSYSAALNAIGLDCEASWRHLQEGTYPIDATQQNLDRLAVDAPDLRSIADWTDRRPGRYSRDPVILVLTEDSE